MENCDTFKHSYSSHQSHDRAMAQHCLPFDTSEEDIRTPLWQRGHHQLEPQTLRTSLWERTTSTLSTTSTQSSYAFISDLEISSRASITASPAGSSPTSSAEEQPGYRRRVATAVTGHVSPVMQPHTLSLFSSLESLHSPSGRLLILGLVLGPVPQQLSPSAPIPVLCYPDLEVKYNMDPISLVLFFLKDRHVAWHQGHHPSVTIKLVTHYLPPHPSLSYVKGAELYLEAGLLHLEGAASIMLSASYAALSLIRVPLQPQPEQDRDAASCYFDRARAMNSDLDVPVIMDERSKQTRSVHELEMPSLGILHCHSAPESTYSGEGSMYSEQERVVRRRKQGWTKDELIFINDVKGKDDIDNAWYLYIPSLVRAATALLAAGAIGTLSLSSGRRNQGC
ncbi:hypothetical protein EDC04DRAFT_2867915 [Pisolithus marmoratus]|nr:hypothetical protein EDC04DRAFT_2867915 [Pisolithus marmoratus]